MPCGVDGGGEALCRAVWMALCTEIQQPEEEHDIISIPQRAKMWTSMLKSEIARPHARMHFIEGSSAP